MGSLLRALARDRVALGVTALGLACLLPSYLAAIPEPLLTAFNDRFSDPLMIGVVLCVVASRASRASDGREKRFWGFVAAGLVCYFGVQAVDAFVPLARATGLALQGRNLLYVGLYVFLVIALDGKPHLAEADPASAGWRLRVDVAASLVLGLGLFLYFSVLPELAGNLSVGTRARHTSLLFLVFDAYLVLKTVEAFREAGDERWRGTWAFLLLAEASWLVADGAEGLFRGGILLEPGSKALLNAAWLPPYLGLAYAARLGAIAPAGERVRPEARPAPDGRSGMTGPLWLHAGALPVVHVFLDAGGALDRNVAGLQGVCALVVFGVNALLADVSRRRLASDSGRLDEARARAAAAERLAYEDPLTGLPSRHRGLQRLDALLSGESRAVVTVALVDVDRFRAVNQVLGNAAGDELLRGVARRLRGVLRESDFLGRLWDDEFLVVVGGLGEAGDSRRLGRQLLQAFAAPFRVAETGLFVTATVGVARVSAGAVSVASLLRGLDGTVRRGKAAGGDRLEFFDPATHADSPDAMDLELWLRRAKEEDFLLLYRPVVELPGRSVVGFEALLHWRRPDLGLVPVTDLPGSADGAGVPARLTPWVLGEACRAAASWPQNGDRGLSVTVSLSPLQFLDADLPRHVRTALGRTGLAGRQLILGVPERTVARNVDAAAAASRRSASCRSTS